MEIIIRKMQKEDWEEVAEIYFAGMKTNLATFEQKCPTYEYVDEKWLKNSRFVALIDTKIIGWASLSPVSKRKVYEGVTELSIYISDLHKGKGIGTKILQHLFAEAEKQGIWTIESSIFTNNYASIALHEKNGFKKVGIREKIAQDAFGVWRDTVIMERRSKTII